MRGYIVLNVVICEDDQREREAFQSLIAEINKEISKLSKKSIAIAMTTDNPLEVINYALLSYQNKKAIDNNIYVLDINLHSLMNGLDVAARIRQFDAESYLIFLTALDGYWQAGYDYSAEYYLIKEQNLIGRKLYDIFSRIVVKEQKRIDSPHDRVEFKSWRGLVNIPVHNIRCFKRSSERKVKIYYDYGHCADLAHTLKEIKEKLCPYPNFIASHRDTIINVKFTRKLDKLTYEVILDNGLVCPVSRRAMRELRKLWK